MLKIKDLKCPQCHTSMQCYSFQFDSVSSNYRIVGARERNYPFELMYVCPKCFLTSKTTQYVNKKGSLISYAED